MDTDLLSPPAPRHGEPDTPSPANRRRWNLPNDARSEKRAIIFGLVLGVPLLLAGPGLGTVHPLLGIGAVAGIAGLVMNALIRVRRLPRLVLSGLIGGGIAGLIAVGAGARLAMRIVSLTGGRREVTIGGTMFLLILGAMFGAFLGVVLASLMRIWKVRGIGVGMALVVFPGGSLLFGSEETSAELLHEGAGGWLNIPMFASVFLLLGILLVRMIRRVDDSLPMTAGRDLTVGG